jgi:hypothetical protein
VRVVWEVYVMAKPERPHGNAHTTGGRMAIDMIYRKYKIEYDPPPIPTRAHDYRFWHAEYDGPGDNRCGSAPSVKAALVAIDEIEDAE